ncbi:hypothetical protein B0A49_11887 [Cryomyces minteri]|uniref:HNH nuclease domain-containing protein n=1 Tax=Cryomyces minteri TaxID=331657 RepID=A0A4U0WQG9_9PEZI|nr:hypothetical protein B0A49_11887 [Cryomyces minteri]
MADGSGQSRHPLQRPPFGNPATHAGHPLDFDPEFDISFRHPAYKDPSDILIILPGLDHPQGGIHHHTALAACAIVANNRFDGWFTEDREGKVPVNVPSDGVLQNRDYYFQVTSNYKEVYPIVPNFAHWEFPHNRLPSSWKVGIPRVAEHPTPRQSTLNEVILSRDTRCRITNHIEGTECAHLVPRSEKAWFERNMMARYGRMRPGLDFIDNPRNVVLLRSDIHTSFDSKRFAFVPKPALAVPSVSVSSDATPSTTSPPTTTSSATASSTARSYAFVTHVFSSPDPHELTCLYHNVALQTLTGIVPEYLFARFAWTIFPFVSMFLQAGIPRRLVMCDFTASTDPNSSDLFRTKTLTGEECRLLPLRSKSRSASPKKRKPPDGEEDQVSGNLEGDEMASSLGSSFGSERVVDGPWYASPSEEEDSGTETDISEALLMQVDHSRKKA